MPEDKTLFNCSKTAVFYDNIFLGISPLNQGYFRRERLWEEAAEAVVLTTVHIIQAVTHIQADHALIRARDLRLTVPRLIIPADRIIMAAVRAAPDAAL